MNLSNCRRRVGASLMLLMLLTGMVTSAAEANQIDPESLLPPLEGMIQIMSLDDGSTLVGRIVEVRDRDVVFESELGSVVIPIDKIKGIELVRETDFRDGHYWFPNPNYFISRYNP